MIDKVVLSIAEEDSELIKKVIEILQTSQSLPKEK